MSDRFSKQSAMYAAFRPTYPEALYHFILSSVNGRDEAWDCACGNGQVAKDLSPFFKTVEATDHTPNQLANAFKKDNIHYSLGEAESTAFRDHQFDLVTVGQAIHWFDIPAFFNEASRVLKPGGLLAIWGYSLLSISKEIDPIITHFYTKVVGPYWDPQRKLIDNQYRGIDFPFQKIQVPAFDFSFNWTIEELEGYLTTWSAVQKFVKEQGRNPVVDLVPLIKPHWKQERMKITFPLFTLFGKTPV